MNQMKYFLVFSLFFILTSTLKAEAVTSDKVKMQQTKAQVFFFKEALDEFGAISLNQVIHLYAKGHQTRNGVYQYAVLCKNMKEKFISELGDPEENFWIIGGSSPWVSKYEPDIKIINHSTYEVKLKLFWQTSAGPSKPSMDTLKIIKQNEYYCISDLKSPYYQFE